MMKTKVEMTQDGGFRVDLEVATADLFNGQGFKTLPGTVIIGTGFGHCLTVAMMAAQDQFTKNAVVARNFYLEKEKTA